MAIDRTALIQILRQELAGQPDRAGRGKWTAEHCVRVAKLAVALRQAVGADPALDDLVFTAGLFHDVKHDSASTPAAHGQEGAARTQELLAGLLPEKFLTHVCAIVAVHDDKRPPADSPYDTSTHLVQDADIIDHNGAMEVYQSFCYGALHGRELVENLEYMERETLPLWARHVRRLHFDAARLEWQRRTDFLKSFLRRIRQEEAGRLFEP